MDSGVASLLTNAQMELLEMKRQMEKLQLDNAYLKGCLNEQSAPFARTAIQSTSANAMVLLSSQVQQLSSKVDMMERQIQGNTAKIDNLVKIYTSLQELTKLKTTVDSIVARQNAIDKKHSGQVNNERSVKINPEKAEGQKQGQKMVIMGGMTQNFGATDDIYMLDCTKKQWKKLMVKLPYKASFHGTILLRNAIYVFGGKDQSENTLNYLYMLDSTNTWVKKANMNERRRGINNSSVEFNGEIWVMGGCTEAKVHSSVEKYNAISNTWTNVTPMKEPRAGAAAAVVKGKIFICGGHSGLTFLDSVEFYDSKSLVWSIFTSMPSPRESLSVVAQGNDLYAFGGHEGANWHSTVWKIAVDKNEMWSSLPAMKQVHAACTATFIAGQILVIGGLTMGGQHTSVVDVFNQKTNSWSKGVGIPKSFESPACYGLVNLTPEIAKTIEDNTFIEKKMSLK